MKTTKLYVGVVMGAMMLTTGLSSCVKDGESESVTAVRDSKAELVLAQANAKKLAAEAAQVEAQAQAALDLAKTAYEQANAAYQQALADAKKAESEQEKALAELKVAEAKAKLDSELAQAVRDLAEYQATLADYTRKLAALKYTEAGVDEAVSNLYTKYSTQLENLVSKKNTLMEKQTSLYYLETGLVTFTEYTNTLIAREEQNLALYEKQLATYKEWSAADPAEVIAAYKAAEIAEKQANQVYLEAATAETAAEKVFKPYMYSYSDKFSQTELYKTFYSSYSIASMGVNSSLGWVYVSDLNVFALTTETKKYSDNATHSYTLYYVTNANVLSALKTQYANQVKRNEAVIGTKDDASDKTVIDPATGREIGYDDATGKNYEVWSPATADLTLYARKAKKAEAIKTAKAALATTLANPAHTAQDSIVAQATVNTCIDDSINHEALIAKISAAYAEDKAAFDKAIAFVEAVGNPDSDMQKEYAAVLAEAKAAYETYAKAKKTAEDAEFAYNVAKAEKNSLSDLKDRSTNVKSAIESLEYNIYDTKQKIENYKSDVNDSSIDSIKEKEIAIAKAKEEITKLEAEIAVLEAVVDSLQAQLNALLL